MCVNDELYEEECIRYIKRLHVPEEYEVQQLSVLGAKSMADGYNEAMQQTDAKYKVFLHQDVFIVYKNFIRDLLWIFDQDKEIGMIGMVGSPVMPAEGVTSNIKQAGPALIGQVKMPYEQVEAIDGLLMATQADLPWREDIFDGWDFYDVSQSMEFRKKGYKVVVPHMEIPWCLHDDGYVNLERYFKWRDVFLKEYGDMLHD